MNHFLDTVDTIPDGFGWNYYSSVHLAWLAGFLCFAMGSAVLYRSLTREKRTVMQRVYAVLLICDELFKDIGLLIGGNFQPAYLPLHLCSINIFLIAYFAWHPNAKLGNFLYSICLPAATAAMLFPTWNSLPPMNFMVFHSFSVHILLATFPFMLTVGGDIQPNLKQVPACVLILCFLAIPATIANHFWGTNFMFLSYVLPGNPLYPFQVLWGNYLLGIPVLIVLVVFLMYGPRWVWGHLRSRLSSANLVKK